ncbi:MAG: hypothetical protein IKE01_04260 [Clostridia bacterium]|nr:hypothetical protein [Clostridia bacterium]
MGSLEYLKHEVLKPIYCMCNECKHLGNHVYCDIYKSIPPKKIMGGNPYKEKDNKEICKYFTQK